MPFRSLTLALALLLGACLSPTLPLPPPDSPTSIEQSAEGAWVVRGSCAAGARVTVMNEVTGRGVVVDDLDGVGRYVVELEATACDLASVAQGAVAEDGGEEASAATTFVIQERQNGADVDPALCTR